MPISLNPEYWDDVVEDTAQAIALKYGFRGNLSSTVGASRPVFAGSRPDRFPVNEFAAIRGQSIAATRLDILESYFTARSITHGGYSKLHLIQTSSGNAIAGAFLTSFAGIMQDIIWKAEGDAMAAVVAYANNMNRFTIRNEGMLDLHEKVAVDAQRQSILAYARRRAISPSEPYRVGRPDRLSGRMLGALLRPDFSIVTPTNIVFGNVEMLDKYAAHWYRLNYGTGSRGVDGGSYRGSAILPGGQNIRLGFRDTNKPGRPFVLPPGFFLKNKVEFYPKYLSGVYARTIQERAGGKRENVVAIKPQIVESVGYGFLDAGIRHIANTLPGAYADNIRKWNSDSQQAIGGISSQSQTGWVQSKLVAPKTFNARGEGFVGKRRSST